MSRQDALVRCNKTLTVETGADEWRRQLQRYQLQTYRGTQKAQYRAYIQYEIRIQLGKIVVFGDP